MCFLIVLLSGWDVADSLVAEETYAGVTVFVAEIDWRRADVVPVYKKGSNAGLLGSIHIVNFICACIIMFTIDLNKILSLSLSL